MRILLLNPNSSVHITERLAASARTAMGPGDTVLGVNCASGPTVVRDAATLAQAEAATLDESSDLMRRESADSLLLGISLDGLADTLRDHLAPVPVVGMTEAAVLTAALLGRRVGLLTLGPALLPLYRARLDSLLPPSRIAGLEAPTLARAFDAHSTGVDPDVLPILADAARRLRTLGADSVVLAGAVLCGYEHALEAEVGIPVLDGVACAAHQLRAMLARRP